MQDALSAVEGLYFGLQQKIGILTLATTSQADRDAFVSRYVAARTAYWACVNKMFHDDDPQVVDLTSKLNDANKKIAQAESDLGNISKWLDDVTQAVTFASQLATLAAG